MGKRKNTKENSKKWEKPMEPYQTRKNGQDMITDTIWMILKVMVMEAMEATLIPTRYSKPSLEAVLAACRAMDATEVDLAVEPLSILDRSDATNLLSKTALYTTN